jgi:hypothetical protein
MLDTRPELVIEKEVFGRKKAEIQVNERRFPTQPGLVAKCCFDEGLVRSGVEVYHLPVRPV